MLLIKLTFFIVPVIAFLANIFQVFNVPEIIISIIPPFLLFCSLFFNKSKNITIAPFSKVILFIFYAYILLSTIYTLLTLDSSEMKHVVIAMLSFSICIWAVISKHLSRERFSENFFILIKGILLVAVVYLILVIPILLTYEGSSGWAFVSMNILPKRNDISLFFVVGLSAVIFLDFGLSKMNFIFASSVLALASLLTFSRSSYLCLAILLIFVVVKRKNKILNISLILIMLTPIFMIKDNPISNRFEYTFNSGEQGKSGLDNSTTTRISTWSHSFDRAAESPIFGIGHGKSPYWNTVLYGKYGASILFAHNYYITQLFQLGIIGFILSLLFFLMPLSMTNRLSSGEALFVKSIVLIFLIMSLTGEPMYGYSKYVFLFVYCSLLNGYRNIKFLHN